MEESGCDNECETEEWKGSRPPTDSLQTESEPTAEDEATLLFSIALYPPVEGSKLSLEYYHRCACHFVSHMHSLFGKARFFVHVDASLDEELLREIDRASGGMSRFLPFSVIGRVGNLVEPGLAEGWGPSAWAGIWAGGAAAAGAGVEAFPPGSGDAVSGLESKAA
ncbi:unnamed protein product, partial [Choristocarpus tenellus]